MFFTNVALGVGNALDTPTNLALRMSKGFDTHYKHSNSSSSVYTNARQRSLAPTPFRSPRFVVVLGLGIFALIYYASKLSSTRSPQEVSDTTNWSKFAYSQYATDSATLCNAIMVFEALDRLGSKAARVLLYPEQWDLTVEGPKDRDSQLLNLASDQYNVRLQPIQLLAVAGSSQPGTFDHPQETWDTSITKLLAFNLTSYNRVLHLDNDITLLQHLDELFLLPSAPVAMPRAYWLASPTLTSLLLLVTPSPAELDHLLTTLHHWRADDPALTATHPTIDMGLLNARFADSALILPHRPYALLSGEFRIHTHTAYLGGPPSLEPWDPDRVLAEAKLVHFSDWPLPKPWIMWPWEGLAEVQPDCVGAKGSGVCRERIIWKELYEGFRERRKDICRLLSVPAPDWRLLKKGIQRATKEKEKEGIDKEEEGREEKNQKGDRDKMSSRSGKEEENPEVGKGGTKAQAAQDRVPDNIEKDM